MIKPRGEYVLLSELEVGDVTAGGVFLPESYREKSFRGFVVDVGDEVEDLQAGDTVVYSKYAITNLEWEGEEFILLKEQDVFAKVVD